MCDLREEKGKVSISGFAAISRESEGEKGKGGKGVKGYTAPMRGEKKEEAPAPTRSGSNCQSTKERKKKGPGGTISCHSLHVRREKKEKKGKKRGGNHQETSCFGDALIKKGKKKKGGREGDQQTLIMRKIR